MDNPKELDLSEINKALANINDSAVTSSIQQTINLQMKTLLDVCKIFSVEIKKYKDNNDLLRGKMTEYENRITKERERNDWSIELLKKLSRSIAKYLNTLCKEAACGSVISVIIEGLKQAFKDAGIDMIFYKPGERIPEDAKMTVLQESQGVTKENEKTVCECLGVTFVRGDEVIEGKVSIYDSSSVNEVENSLNNPDLRQKRNNVNADFRKENKFIHPNNEWIKRLIYTQQKRGIEYLLDEPILLNKLYKEYCYMDTPNGKPIKIMAYVFSIDEGQQLVLNAKQTDGIIIELTGFSYIDDLGNYIDECGNNRGR